MSRMRLICPNCDAQYEVPVNVIPNGGRDVQCSNCGHTWFQNHPDDAPDPATEVDALIGATTDLDAVHETPVADGPVPPAPQPRGLDPEVADVLREEAALEARARAADALESQPDLGLEEPSEDDQARRAREARELLARMRSKEAPTARNLPETQSPSDAALEIAAAQAVTNSRSDLLPDVEEINQSLRASNEPRRVVDDVSIRTDADEPQSSSGFGPGFLLVLVLAAVAIGVYAFADQIIAAVPQAADAVQSYVAWINSIRDGLDAQVTRLLQALDALSSEAAPADTPASDP